MCALSPRIVKNSKPRQFYTKSTYRKKALAPLLEDFDNRCAYSLEHVDEMGLRAMEVDHHNPKIKGKLRHVYENLFPASHHCNGKKLDVWPTKRDFSDGLRFLNPRKESDYGVHLFEDSLTHEIIGKTPAGVYHIEHLDLNNPYFIRKRRVRKELSDLLKLQVSTQLALGQCANELPLLLSKLREQLSTAIPPIPDLPNMV